MCGELARLENIVQTHVMSRFGDASLIGILNMRFLAISNAIINICHVGVLVEITVDLDAPFSLFITNHLNLTTGQPSF